VDDLNASLRRRGPRERNVEGVRIRGGGEYLSNGGRGEDLISGGRERDVGEGGGGGNVDIVE